MPEDLHLAAASSSGFFYAIPGTGGWFGKDLFLHKVVLGKVGVCFGQSPDAGASKNTGYGQ
ncbi:hypothetical protein [Nitrogeniibacter aestuarii]|uniref:hypothetical protein n=1 Tax=Nitrogeniibacter aestuarii TaxID=2815343 RepID=UPI001E429339|nr:hypothetical protein [Nitrogeniibacter aestuarii]